MPNRNSGDSPTHAAVILVAGIGERLRPLTEDRPKALMDLGGETILGRALRQLYAAGVRDFVLATGYREEAIRAAWGELAPGLASARITYCPNPDFRTTQNSVSLYLCERALEGKSFFKLDGDVVFQPEVLARLQATLEDTECDLAVACDSRRALDEEAMKVQSQLGRIHRFGKRLPLSEAGGETLGIELVSASACQRLFETIGRAVRAGHLDRYYEHAYSELCEDPQFDCRAVEVGDLPWSEVDTLADLEQARSVVRPGGSA
ncbi:MAG TPA: phosphocholine cytidylyltransferase family protein [Polyangiaceae bacterium]|nr:phosphocholine cytidylyltransferase family protein [Polyangiaceae bacterium]